MDKEIVEYIVVSIKAIRGSARMAQNVLWHHCENGKGEWDTGSEDADDYLSNIVEECDEALGQFWAKGS